MLKVSDFLNKNKEVYQVSSAATYILFRLTIYRINLDHVICCYFEVLRPVLLRVGIIFAYQCLLR